MRIFLFLLFAILTGCATHAVNNNPANSNMKLSQWNGKNIHSVISRLGTPSETFKTRTGNTFYIYTTQNYQSYPSSGLAPGYATLTRGYAQVPVQENFYANYSLLKCALIFQTNSNKTIISTDTKGYSCNSTIAYLNR
ncbi:MAG: hypothetical protein JO131_10475 [Gammaproteobacteria bacterium]|nr:hypothetical protein [Gammaproteobacteria bacterium]